MREREFGVCVPQGQHGVVEATANVLKADDCEDWLREMRDGHPKEDREKGHSAMRTRCEEVEGEVQRGE